MTRSGTLKALIGMRMAVGISAWSAPRVTGKLFGLDADANPQSPYLARLFGVRDLALACGVLGSEGSARRQWLVAGLACDVADALAGAAGGREGYLPRLSSALVSATAVAGAAMGIAALRED